MICSTRWKNIINRNHRIGLIVTNGSEKHQRLVASIVKYLIESLDANPLEIETNFRESRFFYDVYYKNVPYEAETSLKSQYKSYPFILCLPPDFFENGRKVTVVNKEQRIRNCMKRNENILKVLIFDIRTLTLIKWLNRHEI